MKDGALFTWILLAALGVAIYLVYTSLANLGAELKSVVQTPLNAFGSAVDTVGAELGAIKNFLTTGSMDMGPQSFDPTSN